MSSPETADLVRYMVLESGGHFLPLEHPDDYTADPIAFVDELS